MPERCVMAAGQAICLNTILGLFTFENQPRNQLQPARSSGLLPNTASHLLRTQLALSPHVLRKPPYGSPRSLVPHCMGQALGKSPTPPPGTSRSNWSPATPPLLMT